MMEGDVVEVLVDVAMEVATITNGGGNHCSDGWTLQ